VFTPLAPGWERFENERYVLNLGSWQGLTFVQRLRLADDQVEETVEEIRRCCSGCGRRQDGMSRPILERLGFVAVAELDVLIGDDFR
jgi:hypothetical protein